MKSEIILAPFATVDDYATNIGPTTPRTALDLDAASDAIREYCGWNIYPAITEDLIVDGSGTSVLMVPTMNLTAVTACTETWWGPDQTPVTVDVATLEWSAKGIIRRASGPYHRAGYERQWTPRLRGVTLTVTHGYATPPAALVRLTLDMARRASSNPNALTQQQVGQRMESYAGRGMLLDERDLLDSGYRRFF